MDMFDKDICDFVEKYSSELDIGQNYLSLQNESDEKNINQNDEEFVLNNPEIQENMQITEGFHGIGHDMTYSNPNELIVVEHEESNKGISNKLSYLEIPSDTNNIFKSESLPASPITDAAKKPRKSYRNCCKAMKTWLINKPETFLPTAEAEFSKYSAEITESLKMKPSKIGRPRLKNGKLSQEKREYSCDNYDLNKKCQKFISSFVKRYNCGYASTMKLEHFQYPMNIDCPRKGSKSNRHTQ